MNDQQQQQIKKYLDILIRYKSLVAIVLFFSVTAGLLYYVITPKVYKATSFLIYQQQKINPSKMAPDIHSKTPEIVSTLMQQVTSRTSLEKIIKDFELYPVQIAKMPLEDVIELMRKDIYIKPTKGDIFEVSYEGGDPKKVLKVTNALSSKFIEENLKYREEKATETSEYLGNELAQAKKNIDKKEMAMRDYKLKYYNEMPGQRQDNVAQMNILQVKLQGVQDNIQELERTKVFLQSQYSEQENVAKDARNAVAGINNNEIQGLNSMTQSGMTASQKLSKLEHYLNDLLIKYKEGHPEVKRIRYIINALEKEVAVTADTAVDASGDENDGMPAEPKEDKRDPVSNTAKNKLKRQIKSINLTLSDLKQEAEQHKLKIKQFEQWIEATPVREAEWSSITRDYAELKKHYDFLVSQNLQAVSVENLERKQKGSQFKIMDAARLPEKPQKPDFIKIMLMSLGLGFGVGGILSLGLDLFDTSFRDAAELEGFLGIPVSCTVPYLYKEKEYKRKMFFSAIFYSTFFFAFALVGLAIFFLWRKGILIL